MAADRGTFVAWLLALCTCAVLVVMVAPSAVGARNHVAAGKGQLEGRTKDRRQQAGHLTLTTTLCLAHCFQQLDIAPTSDRDCQQKPTCKTCAHMCDLLQTHPSTWRRACRPPYTSCDKGCRAACSHAFHPIVDPTHTLEWVFPTDPSVTRVSRSTLSFHWQKPRPLTGMDVTAKHVKFVYVLMHQDEGTWSPLEWTTTAHARVQVSPSKPHHHFRLLAVTPEGVAANASIPEITGAETRTAIPDDDSSGEVPVWHSAPKVEQVAPGVFKPVTVSVSDVTSGEIDAVITWEQRLQPSIVSAVYVLKWSRTSCNVNTTYPHCHLPTTSHIMNITVTRKKSVRVAIKQLTFNAQYVIDVGFISHPAQRVHLVTPPCHHPDVTFKTCHLSALVTSPETKMATTGPMQDALMDAAVHVEAGNKHEAHKASNKPNSVAMVAGFASFIGVAAVCVAVATYVIYRRWVQNKQTARLHSLDPRSLWAPQAGTLQRHLSLGTPGSFRRNPLAAQLSPESLQGLTQEDDQDSLESVEVRRSMWTRISGTSGGLQHLTLTPEVTSTPNDGLFSRDLMQGHPLLQRTSTAGPSATDLQQGQTSGRRASTVTFSSNDLQISSIREDADLDLVDDFEMSLAYKCNKDFSASLHLSMVDPDSESDPEDCPSDDLRRPTFTSFRPPPLVTAESFSDPPSCTTSFSTQEGSYLVCSPDTTCPGGEQAPFLPVPEELEESLSQEIKSVLEVLDCSYYESFFN